MGFVSITNSHEEVRRMETEKKRLEDARGTYVTTDEAARYLGLSAKSLVNWRLARRGPRFIRISHRCVRYKLDDLKEWVISKQVETRETQTAA
jgi:hypothetical protein